MAYDLISIEIKLNMCIFLISMYCIIIVLASPKLYTLLYY